MRKAFRFWLGSRFFANFAKQIQSTAIAWQVYKLTNDPLAVGFLGLAWAVPFSGIALWAGQLIDQQEKRKFMFRAKSGLILCSLTFLANSLSAHPSLLLVYAVVAFSGFCASFEMIASSSYAQQLIPRDQFPRAMGWNLGFFQAAVVTGPIFGGWLLNHVEPAFIFILTCGLFSVSFLFVTRLAPMPAALSLPGSPEESGLQRIKMGLKFIRSQPLMLAAMSLDMVAVFFGDVVSLFPFFAARLGAGPLGFGCLRAASAVGSGLVSAVQAFRPFVNPTWFSLRAAVTVFGCCILCFGLAPNIYFAVLFLAIGGAADGVSVIVRQSIYQALTPDHFRGRVAAVSSIFIATSNEIGEFESGLTARWWGIVNAVLVGGSICLISVPVFNRIFGARIRAKSA